MFSDKKIPKIPPIYVGDKIISEFKSKASIFNTYFIKQCNILNNNSILHEQVHACESSFSIIDLKENELLNLIRRLDISISHGHDGISARMIKICDVSIVKPLMIIYSSCFK